VVATGGLYHDRSVRIGDDEAVVVGEVRVRPTARAGLAVAFQQGHDHLDGVGRVGRPLQREAQQVHAEQAGFGLGASGPDPSGATGELPGEHRLVADDHAVLVGPHLGAEHPPGPRQQHGVGVGHLRDVDPGAAHRHLGVRRVRRVGPDVVARRDPLEQLRLVGVAVAVLGEQDALVGDGDHRVAHHHRPYASSDRADVRR
jgi:hypothetical protein